MSWADIPLMASVTVAGIAFFVIVSDKVNVLSLNDSSVVALGENPKVLRITFMVIVAMMTAVIVAFTGTIGFVGLVAPHIVRLLIGSDCRYLIPASACFGAAFLMFCDCIARVLTATGLPVGVVTSIIGGPMFIYILMKMRSKSMW